MNAPSSLCSSEPYPIDTTRVVWSRPGSMAHEKLQLARPSPDPTVGKVRPRVQGSFEIRGALCRLLGQHEGCVGRSRGIDRLTCHWTWFWRPWCWRRDQKTPIEPVLATARVQLILLDTIETYLVW